MNFNTILLFLILTAAYLNLYLTFKKIKKQPKKTKLPISSKEWREKVEDEIFKSWLSNIATLKDEKTYIAKYIYEFETLRQKLIFTLTRCSCKTKSIFNAKIIGKKF